MPLIFHRESCVIDVGSAAILKKFVQGLGAAELGSPDKPVTKVLLELGLVENWIGDTVVPLAGPGQSR